MYHLTSNDTLTQTLTEKGIFTWESLTHFIKMLPYGRNSNRNDLTLVLKENRGTCSSKHAFLKKIADLNNIPNVKLILGIYKMNNSNTPKIGNALEETDLDYIPEAHCYLKIDGFNKDFTLPNAQFERIANDILFEEEIMPHQVAKYKVSFHKEYIKKWIVDNDISLEFDTVWNLREQCIQNLSKKISKIVFTGPESSGKSTIAKKIAETLSLPLVEEYARTYLEIHGLEYTESDVDQIGIGQEKMENDLASRYPLIIIDTDWTVIEIWKNVKYGTSTYLNKSTTDKLYFLCYPDVPWEYDEMRENPEDRIALFERYRQLLDSKGAVYIILKGNVAQRTKDVLNTLKAEHIF